MRKASVELGRIVACLMVIGVHVALPMTIDNSYDISRLLFSCFVADGVAIFWLISGFFAFNNKYNYGKSVKKMFKTIVIPSGIYFLFCFYLSGWILEGKGIKESLVHSLDDYITVLKNLMSGNISMYYSGHLWYVMVYILVILCFPIIKVYIDSISNDKRNTYVFIMALIGGILYNDLSGNGLAQFEHHGLNGMVPAMIYMSLGYFFYRHYKKITGKKYIFLGVGSFMMLNILRALILFVRQGHEANYYNLLYWYSGIGLGCAVSVLIVCFAIANEKSQKICNMICKIASYTFDIYIIHMFIVSFVEHIGIKGILFDYIGKRGNIFEYVYLICMIIVVFGISLFVAVIIRKGKEIISYRIRGKNES